MTNTTTSAEIEMKSVSDKLQKSPFLRPSKVILSTWLIFSITATTLTSCTFATSPADSIQSAKTSQAQAQTQPSATIVITTQSDFTPTQTAPATKTPTSTASPTPSPSPSPTFTLTPLPAVLPAPLYFLADRSGQDQIWRLERDGTTLTQITDEEQGIAGLHVNPIDGRLAFISENSLYISDPDGKNRELLTPGEPKPSDPQQEEHWHWAQKLSSPRWSQDGSMLAFSLNGVMVIDIETRESTQLISNHIPDPQDIVQIMLYLPRVWSADGNYILTVVRYYEGNSWVSIPVDGNLPGEAFAWGGYTPAWGQDSKTAFIGVPNYWAYSHPGLWRVEASSGTEEHISSQLDDQLVIGWPIQASEDRLLFFMGGGQGYPLDRENIPLMMYSSSAHTFADTTSIRNDRFVIRQALWSPDGAFAIIQDNPGKLILLPADTRPSLPLAQIDDHIWDLVWGVPTNGSWELPPNAALEQIPTPIIDCPNAPFPRLAIGDMARVTYTDGRRLRVRSAPEFADDNIQRELIEGTQFHVIGGPECVLSPDNETAFVFWQIYIPDYDVEGWAAVGDLDVYYIERWP